MQGPLAHSLPYVPKVEELNIEGNLIGDNGAQKVIEKLASKRESIKSLVRCDGLILLLFSMVIPDTSFQIDHVK